jgi:hypothetical protein
LGGRRKDERERSSELKTFTGFSLASIKGPSFSTLFITECDVGAHLHCSHLNMQFNVIVTMTLPSITPSELITGTENRNILYVVFVRLETITNLNYHKYEHEVWKDNERLVITPQIILDVYGILILYFALFIKPKILFYITFLGSKYSLKFSKDTDQ